MVNHEHMWFGVDAIGFAVAWAGGLTAAFLIVSYDAWQLKRSVKRLRQRVAALEEQGKTRT